MNIEIPSNSQMQQTQDTQQPQHTQQPQQQIHKITIVNTDTLIPPKVKEKKMRIQTHTWNIDDAELLHETQLTIVNNIHCNSIEKSEYTTTFMNNLKNKLSSYKQQDILKHKLDLNNFVSLENIIFLLFESKLKCCYCHNEVYVLYKQVREMSQWTLDRINNNLGHNIGNLVIACLSCNLKRRRINKNSFMFTKNMTITRENYDLEQDDLQHDNFTFDETQTKHINICK